MSRRYFSNTYQAYPVPNQSSFPPQQHHRQYIRRQVPVYPPPPVHAYYMPPQAPTERFLRLAHEIRDLRRQLDAGTQTEYGPAHHDAPAPIYIDLPYPPPGGTESRPLSRNYNRVDGEGEDVIDEHVEAQGRPHHGSEFCHLSHHNAAPVEEDLNLAYDPVSISRSSSGNGNSTPRGRRPEYYVEVREVEDAPTQDVGSEQVGGGNGEEPVEHTLGMIVVAMNDLLAQAIELCEVQKQAVTALEGLAQDMVRAVQDLDIDSEEGGVEEEARVGIPVKFVTVEDWTPSEGAKKH